MVTASYMGNHAQLRIFDGIKSLYKNGQFFIATLVFCTSMLTPILKILGLLFLSLTLGWGRWRSARTWVYRCIRFIDPWNMLEVYLLASMVSMVELGQIATVHPSTGVFSFAAVVVLTLMATLSFDPRLLWDSPPRKNYGQTHRWSAHD